MQEDASPDFIAEALDEDIFQWLFAVRGPPDTEFEVRKTQPKPLFCFPRAFADCVHLNSRAGWHLCGTHPAAP